MAPIKIENIFNTAEYWLLLPSKQSPYPDATTCWFLSSEISFSCSWILYKWHLQNIHDLFWLHRFNLTEINWLSVTPFMISTLCSINPFLYFLKLLCKFQVYNIMAQHLYALQSDYHKSSDHPSPYIYLSWSVV